MHHTLKPKSNVNEHEFIYFLCTHHQASHELHHLLFSSYHAASTWDIVVSQLQSHHIHWPSSNRGCAFAQLLLCQTRDTSVGKMRIDVRILSLNVTWSRRRSLETRANLHRYWASPLSHPVQLSNPDPPFPYFSASKARIEVIYNTVCRIPLWGRGWRYMNKYWVRDAMYPYSRCTVKNGTYLSSSICGWPCSFMTRKLHNRITIVSIWT